MSKASTIFLCLLCVVYGSIAIENANAQSDTETTMSPAARRAAVRDSLRRERLQQRQEAAQRAAEQTQAPEATQVPEAGAQPAQAAEDAQAPQATPASPVTPGAPATPGVPATPAATEASQTPGPVASPAEDPSPASPHVPVARPPRAKVELPISDSIIVESLNARDTEIRDVLQGLGVQYGVNILMASDVKGPISVNLHKIQLKDAIRLIAEENGYALEVMHGAVKVVRPAAPPPPPPPAPKLVLEYSNGRLDADIQGADIGDVVRKLVQITGRNIVLDRDARGEVKAFFSDLEYEKALNLLAQTNGFMVRTQDGIVTLYREAWTAGSEGKANAGASSRHRVFVKDSMVTLEVSNAPLHELISAISAQMDVGMVIYGQLSGSATMRVENVSVEHVLQYLLRGTEFTFWQRNGIYFIGPTTMQSVSNSMLIVLKHIKADEVQELLPETVLKNSQIKVIKSQNAVMVMGAYESIESIQQYIDQIDLPVPQILIEALVVDVDMDRIREYGVDLFLGNAAKERGLETLYPAFRMVLDGSDAQEIVDRIPGVRDIISLPRNFVAKVRALEQEKVLKIRSRPQIATLNGSEATITVGQTQYFLLKQETDFNQPGAVTSRVTERFEKIDANVTLTVTPFVTGKGEITTEIVPDFSEPEGSFDSRVPPTLNHRQLRSKVRLRDGETIVLGGLIKEGVSHTHQQFPFLGSIPIVGWLFKNTISVKSRSQLIIFVTPHIYYGRDAHVDVEDYLDENADLK